MKKIKKLINTPLYSLYLGHFLAQFDSAFMIMVIPLLSKTLFLESNNLISSSLKSYGFIPLSALLKLFGGIFFSWCLFKHEAGKIFRYSLFSLGCLGILFGVLGTTSISSTPLIVVCLISIGLFKFFLSAEKAASLLYLLEDDTSNSHSIFFYQFVSLGAFTLSGCIFQFFDINRILANIPILYFFLGCLFILICWFKIPSSNKKPKDPITFHSCINLLQNHYWLFLSLILLFGIDQFTYLFAMNLSGTLYESFHPSYPLKEMNFFFLLIDFALLPIIGTFFKNKDPFLALKNNLYSQIIVYPIGLYYLTRCSIVGFFFWRVLFILLGLVFSLSLMRIIKNHLDRSLLFTIFIAKSIGTLAITSPLLSVLITTFFQRSLQLSPYLVLIGISTCGLFFSKVLHQRARFS
jgi:hypothetical protein